MEPLINIDKRTNHPEWNESYYLAFFDTKNKIGGVSRLGFKPNKREGMTFFFLFLPNGSVAGYHNTKRITDYSKNLKVKSMIHICHSDVKWNYLFNDKMVFVRTLPGCQEMRELLQQSNNRLLGKEHLLHLKS